MSSLFSLSGKVLVTGGTRGIGRAISLRFARAGAAVIANYIRNERAAEELTRLAAQEGLPIELCRADLTSPRGLEQIEHAVKDVGGPLSGFVHCAATGVHRPFAELTKRHLEWTFSLNVIAFFELMKILMPYFSETAGVVAVSSMGAMRALPAYSVVGVPGTVLTDTWKVLPDSERRLAEAVRRTPIGRMVTPDEVASVAQFLCSQAASGIVGHTLCVDGGASIIL
jgi:enoyl-[acyl-carrier protein] reductase III